MFSLLLGFFYKKNIILMEETNDEVGQARKYKLREGL